MKSISSVYKIGNGPSSSHTVGPFHAAQTFGERYPDADAYEVTLFGSLAFTGEGHGTAKAIREGLPGAKVIFDTTTTDLPHPNTMLFQAYREGQLIASLRIFSIGGGSIRIENEASDEDKEIYPQKNFTAVYLHPGRSAFPRVSEEGLEGHAPFCRTRAESGRNPARGPGRASEG